MSQYKLELKQIVDYPRTRMYRDLIHTLIASDDIHVGGTSGLYYYIVLCSFANFRTSYNRFKGVTYTVYPGEWICTFDDLTYWLRTNSKRKALAIMDMLRERHLIQYKLIGRGSLVKYRIENWARTNRVLDYNAPCQKDTGFFFVPMDIASELVGAGKCSEMDILLDMWLNTVYNDSNVIGSSEFPVVYMRNGSGNPLLSYSCVSFSGKHGTVISIKGYLSTMFSVSDVMLDKEEIAMALAIKVSVSDDDLCVSKNNDSVSKSSSCVSKTDTERIVSKVRSFLALQDFKCSECSQMSYILYPLSGCKGYSKEYIRELNIGEPCLLELRCGEGKTVMRFRICLTPCDGK